MPAFLQCDCGNSYEIEGELVKAIRQGHQGQCKCGALLGKEALQYPETDGDAPEQDETEDGDPNVEPLPGDEDSFPRNESPFAGFPETGLRLLLTMHCDSCDRQFPVSSLPDEEPVECDSCGAEVHPPDELREIQMVLDGEWSGQNEELESCSGEQQDRIEELNQELSSERNRRADLEQQVETLRREKEELQSEREERSSRITRMEGEMEQLQQQLDEMKDRISTLRDEKQTLQEQKQEERMNRQRVESERDSLREESEELQERNQALSGDIDRLKREKNEFKMELEKLKTKKETLENTTGELQDQICHLQQMTERLDREMNQREHPAVDLSQLKRERQKLQEEKEKLQNRLTHKQKTTDELKQKLDRKDRLLSQKREKCQELYQRLREIEESIKNVESVTDLSGDTEVIKLDEFKKHLNTSHDEPDEPDGETIGERFESEGA